jgi:hypothetical protein
VTIKYKETPFGFEYGSIQVQRIFSDKKRGLVTVGITSPKQEIQVYATKTGKIRVFRQDKELK